MYVVTWTDTTNDSEHEYEFLTEEHAKTCVRTVEKFSKIANIQRFTRGSAPAVRA